MAFELPALPYDYAALEPTIDEATMKLHHDKHHQTYVTNLNGAVEKNADLAPPVPGMGRGANSPMSLSQSCVPSGPTAT